MITLIDNYDSFTYNLVHYLGEVGGRTRVYRNDAVTAADVIAEKPEAIVLSPGPCTPNEAGICLELVEKAAGKIPLLGVCLGHQAIAQAFGAKIARAETLMHGKLSTISHDGTGLFAEIDGGFEATRYHSLIVDPATLPSSLRATAQTDDGTIMGLCHTEWPVHGVQFHPESIASQCGHKLLRNFLNLAGIDVAAFGNKTDQA